MRSIQKAFVLGAGLGTRLRPLTEELPKPLLPIYQKPLITFAFDHLIGAGVRELIANTHHCPEEYQRVLSGPGYRGCPLTFRHEPVLLETGGGIKNVEDLLGGKPFLVYNGDILTDLPIGPAIAHHFAAGNVVTLVLRSSGGPLQVAFDAASGLVRDIGNRLRTGLEHGYMFTGIYVVEPEFLSRLGAGVKQSVVPVFTQMIAEGTRLGGIVIDEGHWWDVGNRNAYLEVHRELQRLDFPEYPVDNPGWRLAVHPSARVGANVELRGASAVGPGAEIGDGSVIEDSIVWAGAKIASHSHLQRSIIRAHRSAGGQLRDADI